MQRRGVAHALVVTVLAVALCLAIARLTSPSRPAAAPHAARTTAPAEQHGQPPDQHRAAPPGTDAAGNTGSADRQQPGRQEARTRPPTDIPSNPISFVRRSGVTDGVALTVDDGPHPVWTPRILDLLSRYHVHATFCLIGEQVQEYPALVRRIVTEGHTLCDHTWSHDVHLPKRPEATVDHEIDSTYQAIVAATGGVRPLYYRAPGGNWDQRMTEEARRLGMVSLNWSVDPVDWSRPGVSRIVSAVLDGTGPGDVVLVHDGGGDRSQTLAALETILPTLLSRGYSFTTP
jgi:peptidoglycan-N-acetylglucosamine deacetylase